MPFLYSTLHPALFVTLLAFLAMAAFFDITPPDILVPVVVFVIFAVLLLFSLYIWKNSNVFGSRLSCIAVLLLLFLLVPLLSLALSLNSALLAELMSIIPTGRITHFGVLAARILPVLLPLNLLCLALFYASHVLSKRMSKKAVVIFFFNFSFILPLPLVFLWSVLPFNISPTVLLFVICSVSFMLSLYVWHNKRCHSKSHQVGTTWPIMEGV